jgi:hypothetical protein
MDTSIQTPQRHAAGRALHPPVPPPSHTTPTGAGQPVEMGSGPDHRESEYLNQDHPQRPHQGLGNRLLDDRLAIGHDPPLDEGKAVCRVRLGGVLRHDERRRAA